MSILIYSVQTSEINDQIKIIINLEKAEYQQRALSAGTFLNKQNVLGIDKYGELFASSLSERHLHDPYNNMQNFANINLHDSSRHFLRVPHQNDEKENEILLCTLLG